ncbi:nitroreductase family protein [Alicyclobacillus fodiniaquatilis]|jgi:nitroreductase|uniref:Nitroreductase family protein n=1 Tax=Alicyclobacillus fodiniaquatilis TaxID=1661150 RepID=A0ABW4JR31_9BACL
MEIIKERRNIKQFTNQPVDMQQVMTWLDAAGFAPNHRMVQPWEVLVIGPETRAKLNHKANFGDAPLVLAVLSKGANVAVDQEENLIATSCFVQNFLLLAWQNGVGTRWASIGSTPVARETLEVPEGYSVVGIFGVGYPMNVPSSKPRTPIVDKIKHLQ